MNQNLQCTRCGGSGHLAKDCGMPVVGDTLLHAARLIREAAEELRQGHTLPPNHDDWEGEPEAKASYDEHMALAGALEDQHAAIERKDALLRQALDALENHAGNYKLSKAEGTIVSAVVDAITKELQ